MFRHVIFVLAATSLTGCSLSTKRTPSPPLPVASQEAAEATSTQTQSEGQKEAEKIKEAVSSASEHIQKTHSATPTPVPTAKTAPTEEDARKPGPVSAEKSLGWLKNGNTRFVSGKVRSDGARASDRKRLALGQKPHAVILSCSDSRVPPEVVFDQKLGEIFVIRTAGESLDDNVIGSIEYAVQHLGANLVVVMGHEACGAVNAALASLKGADMGSPSLNALVADIKPRIAPVVSEKKSDKLVTEVWANTDGVAHDLLERSAILRDAIQSGDVKIERAIYHMDAGTVEWK